MDPYIVQATLEGQSWFVQPDGSRIDNRETAKLFTYAEAVQVLSYLKKTWKAECEMFRVNRMTRENS